MKNKIEKRDPEAEKKWQHAQDVSNQVDQKRQEYARKVDQLVIQEQKDEETMKQQAEEERIKKVEERKRQRAEYSFQRQQKLNELKNRMEALKNPTCMYDTDVILEEKHKEQKLKEQKAEM